VSTRTTWEPSTDRRDRGRHLETRHGEVVPADLVVDATGRKTPVPGMLEALDVPGPVEERTPRGFRYYTRHFHSTDGSVPGLPAFPLEHHETISTIALPGDSGTWSLVLGVSAWHKEGRHTEPFSAPFPRHFPLPTSTARNSSR
jgi:hypothetical protein